MTFLNPLFLFGIILTGVPIIIHLWFKKKLKKIPFSTLSFLKKSEARRFGWLRLREILILVLRCMFITFLFLSLARPQLRRTFFRIGRLASAFLIIDNSYSMAYGENFALAKKTAIELISSYSPKSEFIVLPLCRTELDASTDKATWRNKASAVSRTNKLSISYGSGNFRKILSDLAIEDPEYPVEYIYIGDGQEINFKDFSEELMVQENFYYWKIASGSNTTITRAILKDPVSVALDNYVLNLHVENFSPQIWYGKVSLQSGDYYNENECEIQPQSEHIVEFRVPVSIQHGIALLFDDSLSVDNVYYFSKSLLQKLNVLIVGNARFISTGLNPTNKVSSPFRIEYVKSLSQADIRRFDAVVLSGVEDISESDKIKLTDFMMQYRKGIICFLDDNVGSNLRDFISICCSVEEPVVPKGYVTLDWVDYTHPIFTIFKGSTTLKNIKFHYFQKIAASKGIIAKLTGNHPFIVADNNLTVVATQFAPSASDIVYKTAFIPLLFRLITSTVYESYNKEFYVGQRLETPERLKTPTGEYVTKGNELLVPGFYTAEKETFGVNVIPEEGNLKTLGSKQAEILNIQTIGLNKDMHRGDMSTFFLLLALFAVFLELVLLLIP